MKWLLAIGALIGVYLLARSRNLAATVGPRIVGRSLVRPMLSDNSALPLSPLTQSLAQLAPARFSAWIPGHDSRVFLTASKPQSGITSIAQNFGYGMGADYSQGVGFNSANYRRLNSLLND